MQMKMPHYASNLALVGMLALGTGDHGPSLVRPKAGPLSQVTQYCVSPDDDVNSYRFYCRTGMADPYRSDGQQRPQKTVSNIAFPATKRVE
jgi:hypothetical protein